MRARGTCGGIVLRDVENAQKCVKMQKQKDIIIINNESTATRKTGRMVGSGIGMQVRKARHVDEYVVVAVVVQSLLPCFNVFILLPGRESHIAAAYTRHACHAAC